MKAKKALLLAFACLIIPYISYSYGSAGSRATYEPRYIIDMPGAGILPKYGYSVVFQAFSPGGILTEFSASPLTNVNIGVSLGASGIIGSGDINFQSLPGAHIKIRALDERKNIPAIVIGFNSQGRGEYFDSMERFSTMSPGAYLALSKAFNWDFGELNFHGGINYSIEPKAGARGLNIFGGVEQSLGNYASLCVEYNANTDETGSGLKENGGTLSASVKWAISPNITAELQIRDLLGNEKGNESVIRFLTFEYIGLF